MSNTATTRGRNQDRAKVAGGQGHELKYEAAKTGATKAEVKSAVKTVGNSRKKVEDKLEPEPRAEVAVTAPPPRVEEQPKPEQPPAPARSAPRAIPKQQSSKLSAAPVQGQPSSNNSTAVQSWKSQVVSMLERNKRYPADARSRRQQGVAQLAFTLDRQGQIASAEIVRSTGSSSLDEETLALVRRAAPFPPAARASGCAG